MSHPSTGIPGTGRPALAPIETCPHCRINGSLIPHCGHPQSKFIDAPAGKCGLLECKVCGTHGSSDGQRWYRPETKSS